MNVSFISAYNTDKNIGGEYNRLIENINDEYIFIKDGDVLFLTPDYGDKIMDIINSNPEYDIIGCRTNRLAGKHQRVGELNSIPDIDYHIEIANKIWATCGNLVLPTKINVAAMCMIIKRKVWERIKFPENNICFDRIFCEKALSLGYKLGIAQGLYVFHLYRWGHDHPESYTGHLIKNNYGIKGI